MELAKKLIVFRFMTRGRSNRLEIRRFYEFCHRLRLASQPHLADMVMLGQQIYQLYICHTYLGLQSIVSFLADIPCSQLNEKFHQTMQRQTPLETP